MDIVNLGNMINDKWGAVEQVDFFYAVPIVLDDDRQRRDAVPVLVLPAGGEDAVQNSDAPNRSLWQIKFGLKYSF